MHLIACAETANRPNAGRAAPRCSRGGGRIAARWANGTSGSSRCWSSGGLPFTHKSWRTHLLIKLAPSVEPPSPFHQSLDRHQRRVALPCDVVARIGVPLASEVEMRPRHRQRQDRPPEVVRLARPPVLRKSPKAAISVSAKKKFGGSSGVCPGQAESWPPADTRSPG